MSLSQVHLITGKWSSGKTYVCTLLASQLLGKTPIKFIGDRTGLEDAAIFDYGYDPETGLEARKPIFCDVDQWGPIGQIQFTMRDGFAMHVVRDQIVSAIQTHGLQNEGALIIEIAIGPDVKRNEGQFGTLIQSTKNLADRLLQIDIPTETDLFFYQIESEMETRLTRQGIRDDLTAKKAFDLYAGNGGELTTLEKKKMQSHGWHVQSLENGNKVSHQDLALKLNIPPLDPQIAYQEIYPQLLHPEILIRIPPEKFEGHPLRLNPEGAKPTSKER